MATACAALVAILNCSTHLNMSRVRHSSLPLLLELHPCGGVELRVYVEHGPISAGGSMPGQENNAAQRQLMRAFAPLHRSALGMASGLVLGGLLSAATLALVIRGGFPEPNLGLLAQFLWGYSVSWPGVLIGLLWGWAVGFVLGWGFALVRNAVVWIWLTSIRSRAEMEQYSDFLDHL
jgi:hypothetical protein